MNLSKHKGFTSIHGTEFYFEVQGVGQPLLFLHAGVGDSGMWDQQFDTFAQTYQVIRCDLRGFGQSRLMPGNFAHYEDVAALLHTLQVGPVTLIGASFGGAVAVDIALAHPDLVTGLILAGPAVGGYSFTSPEMLAFFEEEETALAQGDIQAATESNLKMWVDGWNRAPEQVNPEVRERVRIMQDRIFAHEHPEDSNEEELVPPAYERLATIPLPTCIMVGAHDVAEFQSLAASVAQSIRGTQLTTIAHAAHLPNMEQADIFNQHVQAFLNEQLRSG